MQRRMFFQVVEAIKALAATMLIALEWTLTSMYPEIANAESLTLEDHIASRARILPLAVYVVDDSTFVVLQVFGFTGQAEPRALSTAGQVRSVLAGCRRLSCHRKGHLRDGLEEFTQDDTDRGQR